MKVKKKFDVKQVIATFCFVCLLFASTFSNAQTEEESGPIAYGIKAGLNVNTFQTTQPHMGASVGLTVGVFGSYSFSDLLALQLEAAYFQQGGSLTHFKDDTRFGANNDFFTNNVTTSTITLHNIEIPLLAKISIPVEGIVKPKFFIGPSMGYNIMAKERYSRTHEENGVFITASGVEQVGGYEKFQFGATAGLGLEIPVGSLHLLVDARYRYGFTSAKKSYSYIDYTKVTTDLRVNTFSVTLGIRL